MDFGQVLKEKSEKYQVNQRGFDAETLDVVKINLEAAIKRVPDVHADHLLRDKVDLLISHVVIGIKDRKAYIKAARYVLTKQSEGNKDFNFAFTNAIDDFLYFQITKKKAKDGGSCDGCIGGFANDACDSLAKYCKKNGGSGNYFEPDAKIGALG